jgi:hypothetical protein
MEGVVDYKWLFARTFHDDAQRTQAYSACHKRSAERVLHALQLNGGIYIKLVCFLLYHCQCIITKHVGPTYEQYPSFAKRMDLDHEAAAGLYVIQHKILPYLYVDNRTSAIQHPWKMSINCFCKTRVSHYRSSSPSLTKP